VKIPHCIYCGTRAVNGVCEAHSDLPALDYQFASLRKRLLVERTEPLSEQGKRMDSHSLGQIECS